MKIQAASQDGDAAALRDLLAAHQAEGGKLPIAFHKGEAVGAATKGHADVLSIWLAAVKERNELNLDPGWTRKLVVAAAQGEKARIAMALQDAFGPKWADDALAHWNAVLPGSPDVAKLERLVNQVDGKALATRDQEAINAVMEEAGVGAASGGAAAPSARKMRL